MEGWAIAVLVIILVFFVVAILIYVAIFTQCRLNFVAALWTRSRVSAYGASPSATTLYFFDPQRTLRSVSLLGVTSSLVVRQRVAAVLGNTAVIIGNVDPQTIGLSRVDEGNVLVELDLDAVLNGPNRDQLILDTAFDPLFVSKRIPPTAVPSLASTLRPRGTHMSDITKPKFPSWFTSTAPRPHIFSFRRCSIPVHLCLLVHRCTLCKSSSVTVVPVPQFPYFRCPRSARSGAFVLPQNSTTLQLAPGLHVQVNTREDTATLMLSGEYYPRRRSVMLVAAAWCRL